MTGSRGSAASAAEPSTSGLTITHVGGPTALIEIDGWRLLTDPTFDPPGRHYGFGWGAGARKANGPAVDPRELGRIDAVLLSHDHHADNLDEAGRRLLPHAGTVVTTRSGARRLGRNAQGLAAWSSTRLMAQGRPSLVITATPCRHGPPLSSPIAGDVIGFAISRDASATTAVWITGDSVLYRGLRNAAARLDVDVALVHAGGVRFPVTGPARYTMSAQEAVELIAGVSPRIAVPIHYEGWSHFVQGRAAIEAELRRAPEGVRSLVRWLAIGQPVAL